MPHYHVSDDDDFPPLSRQDLVQLRSLLIKIEEAGGIGLLSDDEVTRLRNFAALMGMPGISDILIAMSEDHVTKAHWRKVRGKWMKLTSRLWRFTAWFTGVILAIALGISQLGDAVKNIRTFLQ